MSLAALGPNEWIAIVSALVALASFVASLIVVRRQNKLQFEQLKAHMDAEVMDWAQETIDVISEGMALTRGLGLAYEQAEAHRRAIDLAQRLSGIADKGRLFFPNTSHDKHGVEKEGAFRGYRPAILDAVVFAHYQLDRLDPAATEPDLAACEYLMRCRRLLVSEVQRSVDPRRRGKMLKQLASGRFNDGGTDFAAVSQLGEDLRARYPELPIQPRGAEWVARREKEARR